MKNIRYLRIGVLAIGWVASAAAYADDLVEPHPL